MSTAKHTPETPATPVTSAPSPFPASLTLNIPRGHQLIDGRDRVHLSLSRDGEVTLGTWPRSEGGIPDAVWHGRTRWYDIKLGSHHEENGSTLLDMDALIGDLRTDGPLGPLLEAIHRGHDVSWNGNNHVGTLDLGAEGAESQVEAYLDDDTDGRYVLPSCACGNCLVADCRDCEDCEDCCGEGEA